MGLGEYSTLGGGGGMVGGGGTSSTTEGFPCGQCVAM